MVKKNEEKANFKEQRISFGKNIQNEKLRVKTKEVVGIVFVADIFKKTGIKGMMNLSFGKFPNISCILHSFAIT